MCRPDDKDIGFGMCSVADVLRVLPSINRADFVSLAKEFGCMRHILLAQQQQLQQCPGIGPKKVRALLAAFQEPFFPEVEGAASFLGLTAKYSTKSYPLRQNVNC